MYIKTKQYKIALIIYAAILLSILIACLVRIDAVCRQQVDTLDQLMELRMEVDKLEPGMEPHPEMLTEDSNMGALSDVDYELICRVVAAEARGEGYSGMLPVTHFCEASREPSWAVSKELAGKVGNHKFYR